MAFLQNQMIKVFYLKHQTNIRGLTHCTLTAQQEENTIVVSTKPSGVSSQGSNLGLATNSVILRNSLCLCTSVFVSEKTDIKLVLFHIVIMETKSDNLCNVQDSTQYMVKVKQMVISSSRINLSRITYLILILERQAYKLQY